MKKTSLSLVLLVAASSVAGLAQQQAPNVLATNLPGVTTVAAPPAGFDALTASDEELAYHGFPPRPDKDADAKGYATWAKAMSTPTKRIVPVLEQTSISHGPARLSKASANSASDVKESASSYNWSGYVSLSGATNRTSGAFYYIISDFIVPVARQAFGTCSSNWDYGSTWVGIDGWNSSDVLQAGIEFDAKCSGGSTQAYYSPWYEWYPFSEVRISNLGIAPGDEYFVEVWSTSATAGHAYLINYNANTSVNLSFSAPSGTTLKGNSAEWITERPSVGGNLATLTNYIADPYWGNAAYDFKSKKYTPNGTHAFGVTMWDNNNHPISYPTLFGSPAFVMQDEGSAR